MNGNKLGDIIEPYDGTEDGAREAARRTSVRMQDEFGGKASNIQSRMGATDASGKPKFAIGPNFSIAPVDSDAGQYIWGDVSKAPAAAVPAPQAKPVDAGRGGVELQNREGGKNFAIRAQKIAGNLDSDRAGFSRDMATGAPVITFDKDKPPAGVVLGKKDTITSGTGRKFDIQYAVAEASDLVASHNVDGNANPGYLAGQSGRAVAGNARLAGITEAYARSIAGPYRTGIANDEDLHGVPKEAIEAMRQPVLVRIMRSSDITANIGDETNVQVGAALDPVEQARTDVRRVNIDGLEFKEDGGITIDALKRFVQAMPATEQAGMVESNGSPSQKAEDRLVAAVFWQAYGDKTLTELAVQSRDPEAKVIIASLTRAAPAMMRLEGAEDLDIRDSVRDAARLAIVARRNGVKLEDWIAQGDFELTRDALVVARMFAKNIRSTKAIAEKLIAAAQFAHTEASKAGFDMFGAVQRATRAQVLEKIDDSAKQESLEQPRGREPDGSNAGRQAGKQAGPGDGGAVGQEQQGQGQAEEVAPFDLSGESEAGIRARQEREAAAAKEKADADAAAARLVRAEANKAEKDRRAAAVIAEDKARREAELAAIQNPEDFVFGAAPPAAPAPVITKVNTEQARGQGDIFSQPANTLSTADLLRAAAAKMDEAAKPTGSEAGKPEFVKAPDGSVDFGQITSEQAAAMRRQAGPIRLTRGVQNSDGTGNGLVHIEARHGKAIRAAGFDSVEQFVFDAVRHIDAIWKPGATTQLVAIQAGDKGKVLFLELQAAVDAAGDYYRVNSAFPADDGYVARKEKNEGWKTLWSRDPVPAGASGASGFADQSPTAGETAPTVSPQGEASSIAPQDTREPLKGDRFTDANGDLYEVWSQRGGRVEAFRVVNGKPIVHSGAAEYWAVTEAAKARNPEDRTDLNLLPKEKKPVTPQVPNEPAQQSLVAEEGAANTEDAGAELTYNRRNRIKTGIKWGDIADKNEALRVSETTKQNVYPKPDYEELISDGMEPMIAHLVKQVYDSIAAKPATRAAPTDADLQRYIDGVNRVMEGTLAWAKDPEAVARWAQREARGAAASLGKPTALSALTEKAKSPMDAAYPAGWRANQEELRIVGGNKVLSAMQPGYSEGARAMKAIKKGWPATQESWQKQGYAVTPKDKVKFNFHDDTREDGAHYTSLTYRAEGQLSGYKTFTADTAQAARAAAEAHRDSIGAWVTTKKNGDIIGSFTTEEQAKEAARTAVKRDVGTRINDKGISVEAAERTGEARRMEGEDVSSDKLKDTFGFKGVNFGTWMKGKANEKERQLHLNHAYDSFVDLAELLGVPPKAVSLNGMLGVAIGAQGGGSAAAHFVPGVNEINLTRTSGAGSLAHEWGHALDHYFATQAGIARSTEPFLTEHVGQVDTEGYTKRTGKKERAFGEGLRPEIAGAFKVIVEAMNKKQETQAQVDVRITLAKNKAKRNVEGWLKAIKRDFMASQVDEQKFDALAARILNLDLGDGKIAAANMALSPAVDELRTLYKEKTGRLYSLDQVKGLQSNVDHAVYLTADRAAERDHIPQQVSTDYAVNATVMDKDKKKPYWSTNLEKFARAFDAFVSDKLEVAAAKNTYLSHAGRSGETVPTGDERTAINGAFQALVDAIETKETDAGVAMFSRSGDLSFASDVLTQMAAVDELFRYPVSKAGTIEGVMADVAPASTLIGDATREDERAETGADKRTLFRTANGRDVYVYERGNEVWMDVSRLEEGEGGSQIYAAVMNYAHNSGKMFVGDPAGLSEAAIIRRTSNMLSSALRFGTTKHLAAAAEQLAGLPDKGILPLKWAMGDDVANVRSLIDTFLSNLHQRFPQIKDYSYDFARLEIIDSRGRPVDPTRLERGAGTAMGRASFSGRGTLQRGIFLESLVRSESGERPRILEVVLRRASELVADGGLAGTFSRTSDQSKPTGLTESAFAQAVADAFGTKAGDRLIGNLIIPLADQSKLPAHVVPFVRSGDTVYGFYDPKTDKTYAVLSSLTESDVRGLVMHELGVHYGFEKMLGEAKYAQVMKRLDAMAKAGNVAVKEARRLAEKESVNADQVPEETLAYLVQNNPKLGIIKEIIAAVRSFLFREFGILGDSLTEADLMALARASVQRAGIERGEPAFVPAFAREGASQTDTSPQFSGKLAPTFYSALSRQIEGMNTKAASAQGWREQIKGMVAKGAVKQAELDAVGLEDYLETQKGKITKDQVLAFLGQNGVRVEEVMLGGLASKGWDVFDPRDGRSLASFPTEVEAKADAYARSSDGVMHDYAQSDSDPNNTKFAQYQLPGAKEGSYRELLLTLPERRDRAAMRARLKEIADEIADTSPERYAELYAKRAQLSNEFTATDDKSFRSSHYDQANILAHVRFNERTDAEGKKVLFIEEIQSDWAQAGRKQGFSNGPLAEQPMVATINTSADRPYWEVRTDNGVFVANITDPALAPDLATAEQAVARARELAAPAVGFSGIPRAPFVDKTDAWLQLALKRMIRYAADNGFDRVAWTTGEQQVQRYKDALQKAVDRIEWKKTPEGVHLVGYKGSTLDQLDAQVRSRIQYDLGMGIGISNHLFPDARRYRRPEKKSTSAVNRAVFGEDCPLSMMIRPLNRLELPQFDAR